MGLWLESCTIHSLLSYPYNSAHIIITLLLLVILPYGRFPFPCNLYQYMCISRFVCSDYDTQHKSGHIERFSLRVQIARYLDVVFQLGVDFSHSQEEGEKCLVGERGSDHVCDFRKGKDIKA